MLSRVAISDLASADKMSAPSCALRPQSVRLRCLRGGFLRKTEVISWAMARWALACRWGMFEIVSEVSWSQSWLTLARVVVSERIELEFC